VRLTLADQLIWLAVLALPVDRVSWTVTHEEVFREPREYCDRCSRKSRWLMSRKFFFVFTCEYCFSHDSALVALVATDFRLLLDDWRGAVVALANVYVSA
jgi:hypothetical protein